MRPSLRKLGAETAGGVLVEAAVMISIIFVFVLGGIDFLFAFYQYNAAAKAMAVGARVAAVWDPVASGLNDLSANALADGYTAGGAMPAFVVTCNLNGNQTCTCDSGYCAGVVYSADALTAIVCGRGFTGAANDLACAAGTCPPSTSTYLTGMCQLSSAIRPANVKVVYTQPASGGLGYAGRPGGPAPTITLSLQNVPFTFYFLGGLLNFAKITMPGLTTSITGEYMSSSAP